tara:strand:+ start:368 stop:583 length:216 start_codon:yes stop_codon:yes gene_type:complete
MKRKAVGIIYYYEGDSVFKYVLDPEFLEDKHPVLITDWLDDLAYQANQESKEQILKTRQLVKNPLAERKDL